jgi:hypothetical protein
VKGVRGEGGVTEEEGGRDVICAVRGSVTCLCVCVWDAAAGGLQEQP